MGQISNTKFSVIQTFFYKQANLKELGGKGATEECKFYNKMQRPML